MKNSKSLKKCMALVLAVMMIVMSFGTSLPKEVSATSTTTENPEYMLKLTGTEGQTSWIYQLYGNTNDNTEYVFSCDYYVPEDCDTHGRMWGGKTVTSSLFSKGRGTMTMSYTTLENDGGFYVGFQASSQVECYVWNLSLKEKGSNTELLNNADFSNGLLNGWSTTAGTVAQVLPFDESIFDASTDSENSGYMAKINGTYTDSNGNAVTGGAFTCQYEGITAGKTYTVAFDYSAPEAGSIELFLWTNTFGGNSVAERLTATNTEKAGTVQITYTAEENVTVFFMRIQENKGNDVYIRNVRLTEEGSTENLISNGDFSQGWIGYLVAGSWITTEAASDEVKEKTNGAFEIVPYDESIFDESTDSENSGYMAKINGTYTNSNGNEVKGDAFTCQYEGITAGKTYTVAFDYNAPEVGSVELFLWTNAFGGTNVAERLTTTNTEKVGTVKIKYTAAENVTVFFMRIQENKGNDVYIRNVRLTEEGSTENLITNGDFSQGWIGYLVAGGWITTEAASDEVYGKTNGAFEIVPYDASLWTEIDDPDYIWDEEKKQLFIRKDINFDLQTIKDIQQEDKLFIGWLDQNGTALEKHMLNGYDFSKDTVLTAQYIDYIPEEDFAIRSVEMRTEGQLGLRFIVEKSDRLESALPDKEEYGAVILPSEILDGDTWADLTYDGTYNYNGKTFKTAVVEGEKTYRTLEDSIYYTCCVTNLLEDKYDRLYTVKGYIKYTDLNGVEKILYTDYVASSPYLASMAGMEKTDLSGMEQKILEKITTKVKAKYEEERAELDNGTIKDIVGSSADPTGWIYQLENGIMVREASFDSGTGGEPVEIIQISDPHYNYMNAVDFEEANPTLLSTYQHRLFLANGTSAPTVRPALEYARTADQVVITGDVIDYLSHGTIELMQREIMDKYPNTLMTVGNHEFPQQMQGKVSETLSIEMRKKWVADAWSNDIYYASKVLKDKVMVITLGNGENQFYENQIEPLQRDLEEAREQGYVVLLFMHIPIVTMNSDDINVVALRQNDPASANFYNSSLINPASGGATESVYNLIVNNADVVKGIFNGHMHSDFYTEVQAKTASGEATVIPQYTLTGAMYDQSHLLKITVK